MKLGSRRTTLFCFICCLVYFSSYVTRINYGAAISEIILSLGITKTLASMAVTGSFITYGVGQIICGIVGDYIKPKTMIFLGLFVSSVCNITMAILSDVFAMTVVWCINGLAQSMLWPPLTRIMSENFSPQEYKKACVAVSVSSSAATFFIYLIVPLIITLFGWRSIFLFSAVWGLAVGFLWLFSVNTLTSPGPTVTEEIAEESTSSINYRELFFNSGFIFIIVIVLLHGVLRDGITTWMPSYLNDIFHFDTSISILSTAILPVFSIISTYAVSYIHKLVKDELKTSALIWIVALICSFILIFVFATEVVASALMMLIISACMHGINLMLISIFPARYKNTGRVSTISGIINAFVYVGSAISTYGIAALSDTFGWKTTIITWCIVALCGTIASIICVKKWSIQQKAIT